MTPKPPAGDKIQSGLGRGPDASSEVGRPDAADLGVPSHWSGGEHAAAEPPSPSPVKHHPPARPVGSPGLLAAYLDIERLRAALEVARVACEELERRGCLSRAAPCCEADCIRCNGTKGAEAIRAALHHYSRPAYSAEHFSVLFSLPERWWREASDGLAMDEGNPVAQAVEANIRERADDLAAILAKLREELGL